MSAGPTIRYTLQLVLTGRESAEELKNTITTLQNRIQTTGQTLGTALGGGAQRANISLRQTADGVKETVTVSGQLNDSMKQVNNTLGQTGNSLTNVANNFIKLGSIAHQVMSIYTQYTVWTIRMLQYQNQYRSAILREQRLMRDLITVDKEHGVVLQQNIKYYKDLYQTQMQAAPNFDKVRQATNGLSEAINLYGESSDAAREAFVEYKDAIAQWGESVMKVAQPQDRAGLQTSISQIIDQLNTAVNTGNFSGWQDLGAQNWDKQWGAKYGSLGTYGMSVNSLMDTDTQNLKNMINQTIPIQYEINKTTLDWAAQMEASAYDIYTSGQKLSQANQEMSILGVAIALQGLSIFMQVGQLFGGVLGKLVFGTVGSAGGSLLGGGGSMLGGSLLGNAAGAAGNAMGTAPLIAGGAAAGMTAAQWGGLSLGTKLAYSPLGGLAMKATAPLYTSGLLGSTAASGGTMSALMVLLPLAP